MWQYVCWPYSICVCVCVCVCVFVCVSQAIPHLPGLLSEGARGPWLVASMQEQHVQLQPPRPHRCCSDGSSFGERLGWRTASVTLSNNRLCAKILMLQQHTLSSRCHTYRTCVDLLSWPSCSYLGSTDIWILKADTICFGWITC